MSTNEPCKTPGCLNRAKGQTGFCFACVNAAYPCAIKDCKNKVAGHSRSRCCHEHRREGRRRLRKGVRPWEV